MSNPIETAKAAANYQSLFEGMVRDPFRAARDLQNVQFTGMATTVCGVQCTLYSSGAITVPGDMEANSDAINYLREAVAKRAATLRANYDYAKAGFANVSGGVTDSRMQKMMEVLENHRAKIVEVSDERTGQRYRNAKCRKGMAKKLGGGGRNRGSIYAYQVWADWSSEIENV